MPFLDKFQYDADYFERGLETGISAYQNYRWMPEKTMSMAMAIIDHLEIEKNETILDFGCAKGFLVKALRLLHRKAWGVDTSIYAIDNKDPYVAEYCQLKDGNVLILDDRTTLNFPTEFDYCIAKDVFEHIPEKELIEVLQWIPAMYLFVVVPLGKRGGKFIAPVNDLDITHVNAWSLNKWQKFLFKHGWSTQITYKIEGIKDSYYEKYPKSHGFLMGARR